MLLLHASPHSRIKALCLFLVASALTLGLLHSLNRLDVFERVPRLAHSISSITGTSATPAPDLSPLPVPAEYELSPSRGPTCVEHFSEQYLEDFSNNSVSYCSPGSSANITCFHSNKTSDGHTDSMCFGRGAAFDADKGKFSLECAIRDLSPEEKKKGLVSFQSIRSYWYETGPPRVFAAGVEIREPPETADRPEEAQPSRSHTARAPPNEEDGIPPGDGDPETPDEPAKQQDQPPPPPRNFFLLKREGEGNVWHCLMEIFSTWMSFDILQMSRDPSNGGAPFFQAPENISDTQVIILDDRKDGPYFDLWTLFAARKPMRLRELADDPAMAGAIRDANIIVPLAGSSNPLWQNDWEKGECASPPTVSVFAQRVVEFYDVPDPAARKPDDPIAVTFIDRTGRRRLQNQTAMIDELKRRDPRISIRSVDFAAIPFSEQLRVVRNTDVLVGVHGAGLTHAFFMREYAGAVVEIQPEGMNYRMFQNVALMRGLEYFRVHADSVSPKKRGLAKRDKWASNDVRIETDRFVDVVETAVKSLYVNGVWDYDAN